MSRGGALSLFPPCLAPTLPFRLLACVVAAYSSVARAPTFPFAPFAVVVLLYPPSPSASVLGAFVRRNRDNRDQFTSQTTRELQPTPQLPPNQ